MALLAALLLSVALLLASAKAHGRQVRLERELEGHREVAFGGTNPPFVEALWRRDRFRFWTVTPLTAALLFALLWQGDAGRAPLPPVIAQDPSFGGSLLLVLLWPPTVGFLVCGAASAWSLRRRLRDRPSEPAWRRDAVRGSLLWWALVLALGAATAWASASA